MTPILAGLLVFFARVLDMTLDTLRMLFVIRGRKALAGGVGSLQAAVFILAIGAVLNGPLNFWMVMGYSIGFGTGIVVGMTIEGKLALGHARVQVYSQQQGLEIAQELRQAGHAATLSWAQGMKGSVDVIECVVSRKHLSAAKDIIQSVDEDAFITVDEIYPMRGHFCQTPGRLFRLKSLGADLG